MKTNKNQNSGDLFEFKQELLFVAIRVMMDNYGWSLLDVIRAILDKFDNEE